MAKPEPRPDAEAWMAELRHIPDPARGLAELPARPMAAPSDRSATRPQRRTRLGAGVVLALAWVALIALRVGVRDDIGSGSAAIAVLLMLAVACLGVLVTLSPSARGLGPSARLVQALGIVLPSTFAVIASFWSEPTDGWGGLGGCLGTGALMAVVPLVLAAVLLRGSFLTAPVSRGAVIGSACGLIGAAGLHAHCAFAGTGHLVLGHGLPVLAGALVGAALGALRGRA